MTKNMNTRFETFDSFISIYSKDENDAHVSFLIKTRSSFPIDFLKAMIFGLISRDSY